jgi:hypothetical protein
MGIVPYEILLRDIPFLKQLWAQNDDLKFQRGHMCKDMFHFPHYYHSQRIQLKFFKFGG